MVGIRLARHDDLCDLLAILNEAVVHTTASWDDQPWTLEQFEHWYGHKAEAGFPVLVAEEDGAVIGYATYGEFRSKAGYASTVEHSIYLAPSAQGRGVGKALMQALIERARSAGFHVMVGLLSADNIASLRLHESLGFLTVGRLPEVGRKFDRWLDLIFVQLDLS